MEERMEDILDELFGGPAHESETREIEERNKRAEEELDDGYQIIEHAVKRRRDDEVNRERGKGMKTSQKKMSQSTKPGSCRKKKRR